MKWLFLIGLIAAGFLVAILRNKHEQATRKDEGECQKEGCGVSCFCDDEALKRSVRTEIEYFDDEELDQYKGIEADNYTEEAVKAFDEVLTTLRSDEVGDWLRSLELREINLPEALRDEALMRMEK